MQLYKSKCIGVYKVRLWVRAILVELKARGVNFHLFMACRALANEAAKLKKEREKIEADNLILESQLRELQRINQAQSQQLFTQDYTVLSLRGELARVKGDYAIRN
jgi:hypothetical protein